MIGVYLQPGEVAWAAVCQPSYGLDGKRRPVVLVSPWSRFRWLVMGLTTLTYYADGSPRTRVPNPRKIGLVDDCYLWSRDLTCIEESDIVEHVGWADNDLITLIANQTGRSEFDVMPMRPYSRQATKTDRKRTSR